MCKFDFNKWFAQVGDIDESDARNCPENFILFFRQNIIENFETVEMGEIHTNGHEDVND